MRFQVPAAWQGRPLRILCAAADEQAWVYVNGTLVKEHSAESERKPVTDLWETPFVAEVPPANVNYGAENLLAVRVHSAMANGGLWRPVLVQAAPGKTH